MMSETADLVIIGAGLFGLATARVYIEAHPDEKVVVFDSASSLGGTWAHHRLYPMLKTNNILGTYEFPDFPMHAHQYGVAPNTHIPGQVVHKYLDAYATKFKVREQIRFNTKVSEVTPFDNDQWVLTLESTTGLPESCIIAKKLVVATGMTGNPNMPTFQGISAFEKPLFHAKDFLHHDDLLKTANRVTVYGGAKSAYDAVSAYCSSGVKVDWVIRTSGKGACWMVPPFVSTIKVSVERLIFMRIFTWLAPCIWGAQDGFEWIRNLLQTSVIGMWLVRAFFSGIGNDVLEGQKLKQDPNTSLLIPWSDLFWSGTSVSILNYSMDFYEHVRAGNVKIHHADIASLSRGTIHLSNGESFETDGLHCSTGWIHSPPINISPDLAKEMGMPYLDDGTTTDLVAAKADAEIHERFPILRDQPNVTPKRKTLVNGVLASEGSVTPYRLYRLMAPPCKIDRRNFAMAGAMLSLGQPIAALAQALWITSYLDGTLEIPSSAEAEYSAGLYSRFGRWRSPAGAGMKHGDMVFETLPYYDQLLEDIGLKYKRKVSLMHEIFAPYTVEDYSGLVEEWMKLRRCSPATIKRK